MVGGKRGAVIQQGRAPKEKVELDEFMKDSAVKFPLELSHLPYWDEIRDYRIDLMHLIKNLGEHVGDTLTGADFDEKVGHWAGEFGIKPEWWATDDTGAYYTTENSPWQMPEVKTSTNRSRDGARTWSRDGAFPRDWGSGLWNMLKMNSESKSKRLKAREYLIMFVTGMLCTLATLPRDDDITNTFAASMGVLTAIIRKLVSHSVN
ncbi:hypothetical protein CYMTET_24897 [Cymbomonas tetramitiformis]|uniref:Uncharacterized protein n=1 Tax=Cymbomonas tetramitiformis TaxID=36881 RepID=A0AAE0KZF7_9CHLO|nr:hypothetical protein CYMTET_24897 [Cymbomonas tetramitiformis]